MIMKQMTRKGMVLLLLSVAIGWSSLHARPLDTNHIPEADKLSESEQIQYLISIRNFAYADDYVFRFRLKHYPPKARTITYYGTLYGHFDPVTGNHYERIIIQDRDPENPRDFVTIKDMLLCRGLDNRFWIVKTDAEGVSEVYEVPPTERNQPVMDEVTLTYFDLLAPYLYWNHFTYLGPDQIKARPSQNFQFLSPTPEDGIEAVTVTLDDEFRAILRTSAVDAEGNELKSMELVSFKKTEGQYIPKTLDYRDYVNKGNKTRIDIIAAAMEVTLPQALFDPEQLDQAFPAIEPFVFDVF